MLVYCLWQNQSIFFNYTATINSMTQYCSEFVFKVFKSLNIFKLETCSVYIVVCDKIRHCPNSEDDLHKLW